MTVQPYNPLVGSLVELHDGDTAYIDIVIVTLDRVSILRSKPDHGPDFRIRFARINAPEMKTAAGVESRARLAAKIGPLPATVYLYSTQPYSYVPDNYGGRIDAEVILASDGTNLSDWMLSNGWAVPYK